MFSTGEQAGFEATIIRPDGTKFNEYDVKHSIDKDGVAVTECWLECEDDAVFRIKTERDVVVMKRYQTSQWMNRRFVDGRKLNGGAWDKPEEPDVLGSVYTRIAGREQVKKGLLTFSVPGTSSVDEVVTNDAGKLQQLGTIEIHLQPGKWTPTRMGGPVITESLGIMIESKTKLARVTKSTNEQDYGEQLQCYSLTPDHPCTWQTFVFKYRHRAALESMGIIEAPEETSPPKAKPTNRKRTRPSKSNINTDQKPNIQSAGPSRSLSVELEGDGSDSDEEDKAWKAAKAKRIKKLQAEIDKLKGGSRSKEKMEKDNMKAKKDQPIDLCSDSD